MTLLKVTLEYGSHTQTLEGDDAERWMDALNGCIGLGMAHGWEFPAFEWTNTSPAAATAPLTHRDTGDESDAREKGGG